MKRLLPALLSGLFLLTFFTDLAAQTPRTRAYLWTRYETGDKPTQTDYRDVFATFFSNVEDSLYISQLRGVDTLLTDATLTGATNRQIPTAAAVKTYVDNAISGGVGAVTSVFGRTGGITAGAGDYTASQITNTPAGDIAATTVQAALNELDSEKLQDTTGSVDADNIATGAVGADELASSGVTLGTYGSDTQIPVITIDADGRITSASNVAAAGGGGGVADGDKTDIDVSSSGSIWTIDTSAVTTVKIANDAVTGAKIATSTIDSTDIATGGIGNTDLQDAIVTAGKIATGAVNYSALAAAVKDSLGRVESVVALNDSTIVVTYVDGAEDTLDVGGGIGGGGGGTAVDTLNNYTALRAYTGDANAVYLNASGVSGLFRRVATGTENGGTLIAATNGVKWKRDSPPGVYYVDWFGAVGDGVTDDAPAINALFDIVETGDEIRYTRGKTYLIKNSLVDLTGGGSNATPSLRHVGYGATIKRADAVVTTLRDTVDTGATTIPVVSTTGFEVGNRLRILDVTDSFSGKSSYSYHTGTYLTITSIPNDSTIVVDPSPSLALPKSGNLNGLGHYPVGSKVLKVFNMYDCVSTVKTDFIGLTLDANVANNDDNHGWDNGHNTIFKLGPGSIVKECTFKNVPSENVTCAGEVRMIDNFAENLYGSLIHLSFGSTRKSIIKGNIAKRTNLASPDLTVHSEGVVTLSSQPDSLLIDGNQFYDAGQFFIAPTTTVNDMVVTGNIFANGAGITELRTSSDNNRNFLFSNNIFRNAGALMSSNGFNQGADFGNWLENVTFSNNIFTNSYFYFDNINNLNFTGNQVVIDTNFTYSDYLSTDNDAALNFDNMGNVNISNNRIVQQADTLNTAIMLYNAAPLADTLMKLKARFKIDNNDLIGFKNGIYHDNATDAARSWSWFGTTISNNTIFCSDVAGSIGMYLENGMVAHDNYLWGSQGQGIVLRGVSVANASDYMGSVAYHNTILGFPESIEVAKDGNDVNVQALRNWYSGTIDDNTSGLYFSRVEGNIAIPNPPEAPARWVNND